MIGRISHPVLICCSILTGFALSCSGSIGSGMVANHRACTPNTNQSLDRAANPSSTSGSEWKVARILSNETPVKGFHFIDETNGWAVSRNAVSRTSDAGATWRSFPVSFVGEGRVESLHFSSKVSGWMILNDNSEQPTQRSRARIYRTVDGGHHWTLLYQEDSITIDGSVLIDDGIWVIATRALNDGRTESLIARLIEVPEGSYAKPPSNLHVMNPVEDKSTLAPFVRIIAEKKCVLLIDQAERLYKTCSAGDNWSFLGMLDNFPSASSFGIKTLGTMPDEGYFVVQSTGGMNGPASVLSVVPGDTQKPRETVSFQNYSFSDASLSSIDGWFLAGKKSDFPNDSRYFGTLLYSSDKGCSWSEIYSGNVDVRKVRVITQGTLVLLDSVGNVYRLTSTGP
jgi:hypothetical protein